MILIPCKVCGHLKPEDEYYKQKKKDGTYRRLKDCNVCRAERYRKYREDAKAPITLTHEQKAAATAVLARLGLTRSEVEHAA